MIRSPSTIAHGFVSECLLFALVLTAVDATAGTPAPPLGGLLESGGASMASADGSWLVLDAGGTPPSARTRHSAIYDAGRHRMVVFGGVDDNNAHLNESWSLTFSGSPAWSKLFPGGMLPSPRFDHSAIYDPVRERMIIFGGFDTAVRNEVWALSLAGVPVWTQIFPGGTPPGARSTHAAIYDPVRDRMVVFGGATGVSPFFLNDVWALSLSGTPAWTQLFPAGMPPSARAACSAIYDPTGDRMVVFGGRDLSADYLADVWLLSLPGVPVWSKIVPAGMPPGPRLEHTAIYDSSRQRMVLFGGESTHITYPNESWSLALTGSPTWTQLLPSGIPPVGRMHHAGIYDNAGDRMVVFDGDVDNRVVQNDLWALTWKEATDVGDGETLSGHLVLGLPHPNPFNGRVSFDFDVPQAARLRLEVFDLAGHRLKTLEDMPLPSGHYSRTWDGSDAVGAPAPGGLYFVRLQSAGTSACQRFVLIR